MKKIVIGIMAFISIFSFTGCTTASERHILEYETIIIEGTEYSTSDIKKISYSEGTYSIEMEDETYYSGVSITLKNKKN